MARPKILSTGPIEQVAVEILEPFGEIVFAPDMREETIAAMVGDAIALVVRGNPQVSARTIDAGTKLKVIGRSGVGYDNVDIAAATRRRIPVVFTPGAGARAVAEGAVTLMLALAKRVVYLDRQLKAGNWNVRYERGVGDLDGATLGIIGLGRIGQILAELVRPFNMTVIAHDPHVDPERAAAVGARLVRLEELLSASDFISIHAALTEETQGLIDRARLARVKRGAYLVNLSRGPLIESLDILNEALADGRLAGVGLDVFSPEPPDTSHPIFRRENCLTAPHCLGVSRRALERIFSSMARDMAAVLKGERPEHVVNPEVLARPG